MYKQLLKNKINDLIKKIQENIFDKSSGQSETFLFQMTREESLRKYNIIDFIFNIFAVFGLSKPADRLLRNLFKVKNYLLIYYIFYFIKIIFIICLFDFIIILFRFVI